MQNRKRLDPEPLHALTRSLRSWVLALAAWLVAAFGEHLPRDWRILIRRSLRDALEDVRTLVVALALAHASHPVARRRTTRPRSRRRGFRHARRDGGTLRGYRRLVRMRARTIGGRTARLRDVLLNLKRWIARMTAHLERRSLASRLVAVAPPACVFGGRAAPACVGADTS